MPPKNKNFKYCIVPECKNTSTNVPEKLFICLPSNQKLRRAWQRAMRRSDLNPTKARDFVVRITLLKTDISENFKKRCERVIYRNKYERNAPEIRNWWNQLFEVLEEDASIPPDKQMKVLQEVLPGRLLYRVLNILSTQDRRFKHELESLTQGGYFKHLKSEEKSSTVRTNKRVSDKSLWDARDLAENFEDVKDIYHDKSRSIGEIYRGGPDVTPKSRMYTDFFKRKPNRAAVWRTLPPLSLDEMNLNQKADAITEKIATEFIEWLRDLGGDEELSLSVEAVIAMFEIGFHANSATSLKVEVKEMPSVPKKVADSKHLPQKAKRAVLHNEIKKDIRASKKKTTYVAFGRRLPSEMQVRPPAENYYKKWMSCDKVPEKLASMAAVWQGITHLKSTRAFCEFLIERPEIKPPKYLWDCGMLNLKNLREKDDKSDDVSLDMSLPNLFS